MPTDPLALACNLIRCPSVTPKDEGVLDVLIAALEPLGFRCWKLPFQEPGSDYTVNLFARLGKEGPHFCFAGHTDVVPAGDENAWHTPPFAPEVRDGILYGRGAEDMKGAIACFVAAVEEFLIAQKKFAGSISLLIAADEEGIAINGTRMVLPWMKANGHVPDMCLVGEPTNPNFIGEMVKIGRRGSMNCALAVNGKQGHAAYPHLAENPVTRLVNILHALKHHKLDDGSEYFQPSNLEITSIDVGNAASNVIPAKAEVRFNIRFNNLHSSQSVREWIDSVCRRFAPERFKTEDTLSVRVTGESFLTEPGVLSTMVADAIHAVTGHVPELSTTGGTSDARFIKDYCPVVEFGTTGKTPHMVNECVKVEDLQLLQQCYQEILKRFFN